ncbi:hypothetical protein CDL15_Pgr012159 [Punica granatum]|uniref:Uncharacterized protein n=1 Tax=Punica granatum TaxID=22663 RepID=A0A218XMK5_PUNGR|nr:hypothetical protein CDL15_Pgr012159 [Punica granatum]PKI31288.1 hypothetical protein CRG98_048323 [Punica granatum]
MSRTSFDEFLFHVPHHFHQHLVSQLAHDVYRYLEQRNALCELASRIQDIRKKMGELRGHESVSVQSSFGEASSSGKRPVSHFAHVYAEEDEVVSFQKLATQILNQLLSEEQIRFTVPIVGPAGSGSKESLPGS